MFTRILQRESAGYNVKIEVKVEAKRDYVPIMHMKYAIPVIVGCGPCAPLIWIDLTVFDKRLY